MGTWSRSLWHSALCGLSVIPSLSVTHLNLLGRFVFEKWSLPLKKYLGFNALHRHLLLVWNNYKMVVLIITGFLNIGVLMCPTPTSVSLSFSIDYILDNLIDIAYPGSISCSDSFYTLILKPSGIHILISEFIWSLFILKILLLMVGVFSAYVS